jgi:hypothetical protein
MHALIGFLQEPTEPFSSPLREWRLSSFVPNKRWFLQTALLYATAVVVVGIFGLLLPVWAAFWGHWEVTCRLCKRSRLHSF